jgi:hypothetical protein
MLADSIKLRRVVRNLNDEAPAIWQFLAGLDQSESASGQRV